MSQPRVTVTFGRNGQRRATVSRNMYSDQINGGGGSGGGGRGRGGGRGSGNVGANNNRKRSVKERLGNPQDQAQARPASTARTPKRLRLEGKWKHDLYEQKEDMAIRQPSGQDLSGDLRNRLGGRINSRGGQGEVSSTGGVSDLREKLSGSVQATQLQVHREAGFQRRVASVVRGSSGIASLATTVRPVVSRNSAPVVQAASLPAAPVQKAQPVEVDENTIGGLLRSLGLSKYLITFQAEEVDMAALRHMGDDDLKELGIPMGPRKKILLAVGSRK